MTTFKDIPVNTSFYFDNTWWVKQSTRTAHPFGKPTFWCWFKGADKVHLTKTYTYSQTYYL